MPEDADVKIDPTPGSTLVRAAVAFYATLRPGEIGLIPNEIAEQAIRTGMAVPVDTLEARLKELPSAAGIRRFAEIEDAPEDEPPVTDLPSVAKPPKHGSGSGKGAWFEFVVSRGADPAVAEKLSRDELIDLYGDLGDDERIGPAIGVPRTEQADADRQREDDDTVAAAIDEELRLAALEREQTAAAEGDTSPTLTDDEDAVPDPDAEPGEVE